MLKGEREVKKSKVSSRKLWAAAVGIISGLAMIFGLDESVITQVSGAVVSLASVVAYIVTEGSIDAAAVEQTVRSRNTAADSGGGSAPEEDEHDGPTGN